MEVTSVRIIPPPARNNNERLLCFAKIVLDDEIAIIDLKVIKGRRGRFVAMPSRVVKVPCPACAAKVSALANFCERCACRLDRLATGDTDAHADVAFPIRNEARGKIEAAVLRAYDEAMATGEVAGG